MYLAFCGIIEAQLWLSSVCWDARHSQQMSSVCLVISSRILVSLIALVTPLSAVASARTVLRSQINSWLKYKIIFSTPCNSFLLLLPMYKLYSLYIFPYTRKYHCPCLKCSSLRLSVSVFCDISDIINLSCFNTSYFFLIILRQS